jgi:hypothetical protein
MKMILWSTNMLLTKFVELIYCYHSSRLLYSLSYTFLFKNKCNYISVYAMKGEWKYRPINF